MPHRSTTVVRLSVFTLVIAPIIVLALFKLLTLHEPPLSIVHAAHGPTDDLLPRAYLPTLYKRTMNALCHDYNGALNLSADRSSYRVGETVTITATLRNQGCSLMGRPFYRVEFQPLSSLTPTTSLTQTHRFGLDPGQQDDAVFHFSVIDAGSAELRAMVDFEVILDSGPIQGHGFLRSHPLRLDLSP